MKGSIPFNNPEMNLNEKQRKKMTISRLNQVRKVDSLNIPDIHEDTFHTMLTPNTQHSEASEALKNSQKSQFDSIREKIHKYQAICNSNLSI